MEYSNTYIDEGDMPQLEDEQNTSTGISSQYIHHENGVSELGPSVSTQHHPVVDEEELLAAQEAADAAVAQQQQHGTPGGVFNNVGQGLAGKNRDMMMQYWQETINSIEHDEHDFKNHQLPLARIKKVMKTDEDVRMISAEAPILFAKGCDVFITELTMRAWIHAEENKRRTLQKSDIAAALTKSDMFDFLIDVVPREEEKPKKSYPTRPPDTFSAHQAPPSQMLHGSQQMHHMQQQPQPPQPHVRAPPHSQIPTLGQHQGPLPGHLPQAMHHGPRPAGIPQTAFTQPELPLPNRPSASSARNSHEDHVPTINTLPQQQQQQQQQPHQPQPQVQVQTQAQTQTQQTQPQPVQEMGAVPNQAHLHGPLRPESAARNHVYNVSSTQDQPQAQGQTQLHETENLKSGTQPMVENTGKDVEQVQKGPGPGPGPGPFYDNYSSYGNNF